MRVKSIVNNLDIQVYQMQLQTLTIYKLKFFTFCVRAKQIMRV